MARQGLMDDSGYEFYEGECPSDINRANCNECLRKDDCEDLQSVCKGSCANCGNVDCEWYDNWLDDEDE